MSKIYPTLTKFPVSDINPEKVNLTKTKDKDACKDRDGKHVAEGLLYYKSSKCTKILQGTNFSPNVVSNGNGFVNGVILAYSGHHNLVIRPEDVWISIITQFSFYINARAEEFRKYFVIFEGKKQLVISGTGNILTASYDQLVNIMGQEIDKYIIDKEFREWILPKFSTTTKDDEVTAGVILMAAMKKYFDYKMCLMCGLPSVTLDGTVEDWEQLKSKLDKLDTYRLRDWTDMLRPIIDEFINFKNGNVNREIWSRVCHFTEYGSGSRFLSGWITAFCYFDKDGKRQGDFDDESDWPRIDSETIPSGVVQVDVIVDDNGLEYKTVMLAGSMGYHVLPDEHTIQPRSGWVISLKDEDN